MDLPGEQASEPTPASANGPWSPPTSPFQNARQRRFTQSRLTLVSRQLTWSPVAARSGPGSQAFTVTVGTATGQAAELVWLCGSVIPSRSPGPQVNAVAVCSQQSAADRGTARQVLAYLPIGLFAPFTGAVFDVHDSREPTEQRIRAIAQAAGLTYSAYAVEMGSKVNATFPGALPYAGFIQAVGWIQALTYVAFGIFVITIQSAVHHVAFKIGLGAVGALMTLLGLVALPPVTRVVRRRKARKRAGTT